MSANLRENQGSTRIYDEPAEVEGMFEVRYLSTLTQPEEESEITMVQAMKLALTTFKDKVRDVAVIKNRINVAVEIDEDEYARILQNGVWEQGLPPENRLFEVKQGKRLDAIGAKVRDLKNFFAEHNWNVLKVEAAIDKDVWSELQMKLYTGVFLVRAVPRDKNKESKIPKQSNCLGIGTTCNIAGACWGCGKQGHLKHECKTPKPHQPITPRTEAAQKVEKLTINTQKEHEENHSPLEEETELKGKKPKRQKVNKTK